MNKKSKPKPKRMNDFETWAIVGPDDRNSGSVLPTMYQAKFLEMNLRFSLIFPNYYNEKLAEQILEDARFKLKKMDKSKYEHSKSCRVARVRVTEIT